MSIKQDRLGLIIQARIGSQRLPEKVILPMIEGKSILDIMICRLKFIKGNVPIVIATGKLPQNAPLHLVAAKHNVSIFSGDEDDVLNRFIDCAQQFQFTRVVRICADNPFIDIELINELIQHYADQQYDYVSYAVNQKPAILTHFGFFAELVSVDALNRAHKATHNKLDLEHVTRFMYTHPDLFSAHFVEAPKQIANSENIRLTVDTMSDFENAKGILEQLLRYKNISEYNYKDVLAVIAQLNPRIIDSMHNQIVENSKS